MTDRKSVPDMLYDALEGALRNEFYAALPALAAELRQWSTDPAWARLGLTAEEGDAVDEIVETTAAQRDLKPGDPVWVMAFLHERDDTRAFSCRVRVAEPNVSFWVPKEALRFRNVTVNGASIVPATDIHEPIQFQPGDKVRCTIGFPWRGDRIWTVRKIEGTTLWFEEDNEPIGASGDAKDYVLVSRAADENVDVTAPECEPLKVGDRVRITNGGRGVPDSMVGVVGTLQLVSPGRDTLQKVEIDDGSAVWLFPDQIERVEPEAQSEPERLKFGQWVRGSEDSEWDGEIGFVMKDDGLPEDKAPYLVRWQRGDQMWTNRVRLIPIEPQS